MTRETVLSVEDLHVQFQTDDGTVQAVDGVSFDVLENEVLGIVGESGSGKTVTALSIMGLLPKRALISGDVLFRGNSLLACSEAELCVWVTDDDVVCEVHDAGDLRDPLPGLQAPHSSNPRGRGIWIARQLCDSLHVWSDATGTHVRMRASP